MIDDDPPLKEGYTRIYGDHTGRWFTDYSPEEIEEMENDPILKILREEVQKEVNREIVQSVADAIEKTKDI